MYEKSGTFDLSEEEWNLIYEYIRNGIYFDEVPPPDSDLDLKTRQELEKFRDKLKEKYTGFKPFTIKVLKCE